MSELDPPDWNEEIGDLSGAELTQISFGQRIWLSFTNLEGLDFELVCSGPTLVEASGKTIELDPEEHTAELGILITAMMSVVEAVWIDQDNAVHVVLHGWGSISVRPADELEAFEIAVPGRVRLISLAGGDFA